MDEIIGDVFEIKNVREGRKGIKVPTNVKQIGNIEASFQVYVEDFVYSYLRDLSAGEIGKEQLAILVGKYAEQDGQEIVLIRGALCGKHMTTRKGSIVFTEKSWETVYEEKEKYFPEEEIIGWVRSQPGFGVFLSGYDQEFHETFFNESHQLAYVIDPIEKTDAFFQWKENQIRKMYGYFIYYDKNNSMHDYMVENRLTPEKTEKNTKEDFIRNLRKQEKIKKAEKTYKKTIQGLMGISVGLSVMCVAMGAGIYNTKQKLDRMSSQYEALNIKLELLSRQTDQAKNAFVMQPVEEKPKEQQVESAVQSPENTIKNNINKNTQVQSSTSAQSRETSKTGKNINSVKYTSYTVKTGDSLLGISLKQYGDGNMIKRIMQLNGMDNPNKIVIGQKLKLPVE